MPIELIVFTADRRISGSIPLADDRVSDMLNSVSRVVIRGAEVTDLVEGGAPEIADVTVAVGSIVAVLANGRRGVDALRRKTEVHHARIGLVRFVVSGQLHVAAGKAATLDSDQPQVVLAGRDVLVPLTDASITYDCGGDTLSETSETILVNRAHAAWIDLDDDSGGDDASLTDDRPVVYHAAMAKDFPGAT
jgi:hypothetical protein